LGIGDWGLGIGDWGLGSVPNPQSPIPNPHPQNKVFFYFYQNLIKILMLFYILYLIII